jgi:signal transduction histidine kinase/CheY-like chemotaxis protein
MKGKESNKQGRIKPKVVAGFLLVFIIAITALGITYKGFVELTQMRQTLSDPNQKLIKLNSILTDIYEAESNIRTYTLTQNETYLSLYLNFMTNINGKVDSLLIITQSDTIQANKFLFIQELLSRKQQVLNELVALKQTDHTSQFYLRALEKVERIEVDSVKESSVITNVTTTKTSRRDSIISKRADQSSPSGLSRFFRWLAGKQAPDSTITKLIVEVETKTDTLNRAIMSPTDSLLSEVVQILKEIQQQQEISLVNISTKELELLKSDKDIMDQIRTVVSLLEREEVLNSYKMAEEVRKAVSRSTVQLLSLAGTAFLMIIIFTWLIFRDVSKANFYRNQLINAKQYAERLLKVKEEFMSNMNHEIRTPLSAIVGFARQLSKSETSPQNKIYIEALASSSQHLLQIVNDILDLSKIEGGYLKFELLPFNPNAVAAEVLNTFAIRMHEKGLESAIVNNSATLLVLGDPFRLKQIILNLIGNAVKFTAQGSISIRITSTSLNESNVQMVFEVADTGIGIPTDKLATIFDQFSQVDTSTTRMYGGTGLGLTIVKKLVELQGGTIEVFSKPDFGTTFTVSIPYQICSPEMAVSHQKEETALPKLPHEISIVVVDDDPISQILVTEMLKTLGVKPFVFGNPLQALEHIAVNPPSIVLTDIQMPGFSGIDLVKSINQMPMSSHPPVIALTANSTSDRIDYYKKAGFYNALSKPFNEFDLFNVLAPITGSEKIQNLSPLTNRNNGYDISEIRRFAGDDNQAVREILQSFIDNSKANVKYLLLFVAQKNWKGVGEVAHKMKSAFRQLQVNDLANTIAQLEQLNPNVDSAKIIKDLVDKICLEVEQVQALLRNDIEKIKQESR